MKTTLLLAATLLFSVVATAATEIGDDQYIIFYHNDALGSPMVVTDHNGNTLWHEHSDPYGRSRDRVMPTGKEFFHDRAGSRKGYTGHLKDSGSDLVYMKARYYDPVIGRFYSNDPIGFNTANPMMFNRYAYANSNPYSYVDPDGKDAYLVSRPLSIFPAASHNYIVHNANYVGDPNAVVRSFGNDGHGIMGEVGNTTPGPSRTTHAADKNHWVSLNIRDSADYLSLGVGAVIDSITKFFADRLVSNDAYKLAPNPNNQGEANSNSAAQAIAEAVARRQLPTPGSQSELQPSLEGGRVVPSDGMDSGRVAPGAGSTGSVEFNYRGNHHY